MAVDGATGTEIEGGVAKGVEPAKAPPAAGTPPAPKVETRTETPAAAKPGDGAHEARDLDDDAEPDEKELYKLSGTALKKRLGRYSKSQLKEHFGTANVDEVKAKLKKLDALEAKAEEERKAKLTEDEKTREELAKERSRAEAAEARAQDLEDRHVVTTQERRISTLAEKHIDGDLVDDAMERFAKYVMRELSPKEAAKLDDEKIAKWFEELASSKPKFARAVAAAPTREAEKERTKTPLNNGHDGKKPPSKKSSDVTFDPARMNPKHPQAYSAKELKGLKDQGLW